MHAWSQFCLICWSQTRNHEWSGASSTWLLQETSPGPMIETFPLLVCDMYFRLKVSSKSAQSKSIISRPMMLSPFDCPVFVDRCRELVRCTSISIRWISRYVLVSQFAKLQRTFTKKSPGDTKSGRIWHWIAAYQSLFVTPSSPSYERPKLCSLILHCSTPTEPTYLSSIQYFHLIGSSAM